MACKLNYFFRSRTRKDSPFSWYMTTLCLLVLILTTSYVSGLGNVFVAIHNSYGVSREEAAIPLNAMLTVGQFTGKQIHLTDKRYGVELSTRIVAIKAAIKAYHIDMNNYYGFPSATSVRQPFGREKKWPSPTFLLVVVVALETNCFSSPVCSVVCLYNSFLQGLISGPVLQRYTARKALFLTILIEFIGAFLQFLSPLESEFTWTCICMGIRGAGMGVVPPILLQVVSTHFDRHRAKALMLVFLGYSLSGVMLPFIVDHTYDVYGLKGSWLIHAAMIMQSFLLVKLIRSRGDYVTKEIVQSLVPEDSKSEDVMHELSLENVEDTIRSSNHNEIPFIGYQDGQTATVYDSTTSVNPENEGFFKTLFRLSKNVRMYIIVFSEVVGLSGYFLCNTTLVDYGLDVKLPQRTASVMLVVHGVGELCGKLPTAYIVDKGVVGNELIVGIVMCSSAILYGLLTFATGNVFVAIVFFIGLCFGASQVSRIPLFPLLGVNTTALTYGIASCVTGALVFFLPELIGKFRDEMKDYKYIYFIFGSFLLFASLSHMASHFCATRTKNSKT